MTILKDLTKTQEISSQLKQKKILINIIILQKMAIL